MLEPGYVLEKKATASASRNSSASQEVRKIHGEDAMWLAPQLRMDQVHRNGLTHPPVIDVLDSL